MVAFSKIAPYPVPASKIPKLPLKHAKTSSTSTASTTSTTSTTSPTITRLYPHPLPKMLNTPTYASPEHLTPNMSAYRTPETPTPKPPKTKDMSKGKGKGKAQADSKVPSLDDANFDAPSTPDTLKRPNTIVGLHPIVVPDFDYTRPSTVASQGNEDDYEDAETVSLPTGSSPSTVISPSPRTESVSDDEYLNININGIMSPQSGTQEGSEPLANFTPTTGSNRSGPCSDIKKSPPTVAISTFEAIPDKPMTSQELSTSTGESTKPCVSFVSPPLETTSLTAYTSFTHTPPRPSPTPSPPQVLALPLQLPLLSDRTPLLPNHTRPSTTNTEAHTALPTGYYEYHTMNGTQIRALPSPHNHESENEHHHPGNNNRNHRNAPGSLRSSQSSHSSFANSCRGSCGMKASLACTYVLFSCSLIWLLYLCWTTVSSGGTRLGGVGSGAGNRNGSVVVHGLDIPIIEAPAVAQAVADWDWDRVDDRIITQPALSGCIASGHPHCSYLQRRNTPDENSKADIPQSLEKGDYRYTGCFKDVLVFMGAVALILTCLWSGFQLNMTLDRLDERARKEDRMV